MLRGFYFIVNGANTTELSFYVFSVKEKPKLRSKVCKSSILSILLAKNMSNIKEGINSLEVPTPNKRRLSLIKNDDFAFPSHKRKEQIALNNDTINSQNSSYHEGSLSDIPNSLSRESVSPSVDYNHDKISAYSVAKPNGNNEGYEPIWKYTNNPSIMRYKWIRQLRNKIMLDLKRHFGRDIMHDRLFSCLCR